MKSIAIISAMMGILILGVLPSLAITYGEADGEGHPNVGVLVYQDGGEKVGLCSGTLIASDVFLTAGHCTAYLSLFGIDTVWVSFDSIFDPGSSTLISGTYYTNPAYYIHSVAAQSDLAFVILEE